MSDTDDDQLVEACPGCDSATIRRRTSGAYGEAERYRCCDCGHTFGEPVERASRQPGGNYMSVTKALIERDPDEPFPIQEAEDAE